MPYPALSQRRRNEPHAGMIAEKRIYCLTLSIRLPNDRPTKASQAPIWLSCRAHQSPRVIQQRLELFWVAAPAALCDLRIPTATSADLS